MTAPWKRFSIPGGMGTQLDRVRRLELAHTQMAEDDSPFYQGGAGFFVGADGGTNPTAMNVTDYASLVQQQVWVDQFMVYANFAWNPGTTATYLIALSQFASDHVAGLINDFGIYSNAPLGSGYCFDASTGNYEHLFFRGSPLTNTPAGAPICLEAVLDNGSVVGPGVPFTWASGDILMTGTITLQIGIDESLPSP